jgi:transcription-repair coupling factor (superfamily II helicase)
VAVLVPTTVLALQHHQTFSERFKDHPIEVEELSRFKPVKAQKETLARLAAGKVDVIIGTHRLLGKDVAYKNLGLLVVDEEQRFGVRHKEQIKQARTLVDVLTLTATPIPRTLHMAMLGLRDLSVINTPPEDRLSIRTFLMHWNEETVRDAIRRELARGGQVFFVYNRVQSIDAAAVLVKRLVPEARVVVAHGQMEERRLERVMLSFQRGAANVLVSTSIIESGLDLPNANTLIVDRADKFGLAQLYQIRGRVGRGAQRAYAYLLIPGESVLTPDAKKRLAALQDLVELGSGFRLAAHDLEIRGAGNLLGADQSGHIAAVGYEMFTELLDQAVHEMRGTPVEEEIDVEVDLKIPAFIPESYVPDTSQRLAAYRRLSVARTEEEIAEVEMALIDRYGNLPTEARHLTEVVRVRLAARTLGAQSLERQGKTLLVTWSDPKRVDPARVVELVRASDGELRLLPDNRLRLHLPDKSPKVVLDSAKSLLQSLG